MTIGDLKKRIAAANLPDTAPVLVPDSDRAYRPVWMIEAEATQSEQNVYCQYYDDTTLEPGEKKIAALILI